MKMDSVIVSNKIDRQKNLGWKEQLECFENENDK